MEKLKDIKNIVAVVDYSLYYLIGLIFIAIVVLIAIVLFIKRPKKRKRATSRDMALKHLKNINYEDEKELAYAFTLNIDYFTNEKNENEIKSILKKLEEFKYKKYVQKADKELKRDIKKVIKEIS